MMHVVDRDSVHLLAAVLRRAISVDTFRDAIIRVNPNSANLRAFFESEEGAELMRDLHTYE